MLKNAGFGPFSLPDENAQLVSMVPEQRISEEDVTFQTATDVAVEAHRILVESQRMAKQAEDVLRRLLFDHGVDVEEYWKRIQDHRKVN